jgi:hypothetical protein
MTNSANSYYNVIEPEDSKKYNELVSSYYNWLHGPDADSPVQTVGKDRILFMRTAYEYSFHINASDNTVRRQNSNRCINPKGPPQVNVDQGVDKDTYIVIPVIDAFFHSGYKNIDGSAISPIQMREFAMRDISQTIGSIPKPPTIKDTTGEEQPIVNNMRQFLIEVPPEEGKTFELRIPANSKLADKMEDPTETNASPFQAVSVGYYVALQITTPGKYKIQSHAQGPRQFLSRMNYNITVR